MLYAYLLTKYVSLVVSLCVILQGGLWSSRMTTRESISQLMVAYEGKGIFVIFYYWILIMYLDFFVHIWFIT